MSNNQNQKKEVGWRLYFFSFIFRTCVCFVFSSVKNIGRLRLQKGHSDVSFMELGDSIWSFIKVSKDRDSNNIDDYFRDLLRY